MKEKYSIKPEETWLEVLNEKPGAECTLHFSEGIKAVDEDDGEGNTITGYEADHYAVNTKCREGLLDLAKANRSEWLEKAMENEGSEDPKTMKTRIRELENLAKEQGGIINDLLRFKFYKDAHTETRKTIMKRIKRKTRKLIRASEISARNASSMITYMGWIKRSDSHYFITKYLTGKLNIKKIKEDNKQ